MFQYLLKRIILIPPILLVINFTSFTYSLIALRVQKAANPWGSSINGNIPLLDEYTQYLKGWQQLDIGKMPGSEIPITQALFSAVFNSLGLLIIAFTFSLILGLLIGFSAIRIQPARTARWLSPVATIGLAGPGFFIAALFIAAVLSAPPVDASTFTIPVAGFGWDLHLLLPVITLFIRPTAQIAQVLATTMVAEADQQYVTAARSIGNTWSSALRRHAFRNILAPFALTLASSLRWMIAELILVEWIFSWPGIGRLLAQVLIPPQTAGPGSLGAAAVVFLNPPLLAALLTIFTFLFLLTDLFATSFARKCDPRLAGGFQRQTDG